MAPTASIFGKPRVRRDAGNKAMHGTLGFFSIERCPGLRGHRQFEAEWRAPMILFVMHLSNVDLGIGDLGESILD